MFQSSQLYFSGATKQGHCSSQALCIESSQAQCLLTAQIYVILYLQKFCFYYHFCSQELLGHLQTYTVCKLQGKANCLHMFLSQADVFSWESHERHQEETVIAYQDCQGGTNKKKSKFTSVALWQKRHSVLLYTSSLKFQLPLNIS